jgi:hypothetical protein
VFWLLKLRFNNQNTSNVKQGKYFMGTKNSTLGSIGNVKSDVKRAGEKAAYSPVMEALTRVGYGVRGLIYVIMGLLAFDVALGKGGAVTDQQGAIAEIGRQPAGLALLWVVLIGLVSYALWGIIRAVLDPLHKGHDLKGLIERGGYLFSAASYAILILPTYSYISGAGSTAKSGGQSQQSFASIMTAPGGPLAIGILGLAVMAGGLHQVYQGFKASFDKQFEPYAMTAKEIKWATQLGRVGTATRGIIFAIVGGLLCLAAYQSNPRQEFGIDAALIALRDQPYGIWLLGIVAVGLMAFGIYSMLTALWFREQR